MREIIAIKFELQITGYAENLVSNPDCCSILIACTVAVLLVAFCARAGSQA